MADCNPVIDTFQREVGDLDVSDKYLQLMRDSVSDDSLYIRAKDTLKVQLDSLNLTAEEKGKFIVEYMTNMSVTLSATAMQMAITWSKEERDGAYTLAKIKADTELVLAQFEKTKQEICLVEVQVEKVCADVTATISGTFRENGKPTGYDGCKPTGLENDGLKYEQTKLAQASTYQTQADAFRKSGVVQIGADAADNIIKGLSGDDDGYTNQQSKNAERQRIAYEDSKRNHAANSAATMIGQLLSSETLSASNDQDIQLWRESVNFLNTSHSSTDTP